MIYQDLRIPVEGYANRPNYIVKSALIWNLFGVRPGSFIMSEGAEAPSSNFNQRVLSRKI
jgi:hypothetical protein